MSKVTYTQSHAMISKDGVYRYNLIREWDRTKPRCAFICLNPSTADSKLDDPTVRKCVKFANSWGMGSMILVNLSPFRATDPEEGKAHELPEMFRTFNNQMIHSTILDVSFTVLAWGNHAPLSAVHHYVNSYPQIRIRALEVNKTRQPKHPLYCKDSLTAERYITLLTQRPPEWYN